MDCSLLGSSIHGIFQARGKNTGLPFPSSRIFPTQGSNCISGRLLTFWATRSSSCDGRVSQGCFTLRPTSSQGATLKEGLYAASGLRVGPSTGSWRKERSLNKIWLIFFLLISGDKTVQLFIYEAKNGYFFVALSLTNHAGILSKSSGWKGKGIV